MSKQRGAERSWSWKNGLRQKCVTHQTKCGRQEEHGAPARHLHPPGAQSSTNFPRLAVAVLRTINPPAIRFTARSSPSAAQAKRTQRTPWPQNKAESWEAGAQDGGAGEEATAAAAGAAAAAAE